jgi:arylsulfatase A-like enzyme
VSARRPRGNRAVSAGGGAGIDRVGVTGSTTSLPASSSTPRGEVRLALTAALSVGLTLGFLDVSLSLIRGPAAALRPLGAALASVAVSSVAISLLALIVLLFFALLPSRASGQGKGAVLVALAIGLGTFLGLAEFYNLTRLELSPIDVRTLLLVSCLSLAIGAHRYERARTAWTASEVPQGVRDAFLTLPLLMCAGFLFSWRWVCRLAPAPGDSPKRWVAAFSIAGALIVLVTVRLARRVRVERWLGALALLVVVVPAGARLIDGTRRPPPPPASRPRAIHKILFLTIDTLRSDAVSTLNPAAPPTPSLDALASDSVVFTRAYSPAPWTLPSFVSMMTGVAPPVHGVRTPALRIPDPLPTLAERLRDSGYVTAAIGHNPWLRPRHGMSRGFESYDVCPRDDFGRSLGSRLLARLFPRRLKPTLTTPEITDLAGAWLREHARDDFFLWLHYFDPHGPYAPPEAYRPREKPPEGMGYTFGGAPAIRMGSLVISPPQRKWARELYDGGVRYVDDNVGRITEELKRLGIYDETLIVFASDHGEEFWEHGSFEHGHTLYDELLRVPLFVKLPGQATRFRQDHRASTGGIHATILELCGIEADSRWLSYRSLAPLLGSGLPDDDPILSASPLYYEDREAWIRGSTKWIHSRVSDRIEVFDLTRDPGEHHDLATSFPEKAREGLEELARQRNADEALRRHYRIIGEFPAEMDPEALQQLRSLGYLH